MPATVQQIITEMVTTCPHRSVNNRSKKNLHLPISDKDKFNHFVLGITAASFEGIYKGFHAYKSALKQDLKAFARQNQIELQTFFIGWAYDVSDIKWVIYVTQELAKHYKIQFDADEIMATISKLKSDTLYIVLTCVTSDIEIYFRRSVYLWSH